MITGGTVLLFTSILCAGIGVLSIAIVFREVERGSRAWLLPGVCSVLLAVGCLVRLIMEIP